MLRKKQRLTKEQFDEFFRSGKRFHSPLFQLIHSKAEAFNGAVVVGKKVHKRAVDRNRLRRRVYNILYRLFKDQNLKGVYIIIAKPPATGSSFAELRDAVVSLIGQSFNTKN